jgi:thiol-disulfide isomerase/thioredoxin
MFESLRVHMPPLDGATAWLNSDPLSPDDLRGRVVLVDFWTYTCINWLRTEPHVRAWSQAYRDDGLIVIGVHTPEFSVEHDVDRVRRATKERGIDYPVAIDNDYAVWTAFANHYWPALYFVDVNGRIRDHHFGEGREEESERTLQRLLGVRRGLVSAVGSGVEAPADWDSLRTGETYLGYERAERLASPNSPLDDGPFELPERLGLNDWALAGHWTIGPESVALDQAGGTIAFGFHARDVHLVMGAPDDSAAVPFHVAVDGAAPGPAHGVDVDDGGHGEVSEPRLYQLIRQPGAVEDRTFEITFLAPGAEAFVFTFG